MEETDIRVIEEEINDGIFVYWIEFILDEVFDSGQMEELSTWNSVCGSFPYVRHTYCS